MSDHVAETLLKEWEQFKSENDRRLKEVEKNGRADPLTEEKINKHSLAIGELQAQLAEVEKKANRPVLSVEDEAKKADAEQRKAFNEFARKSGLMAKAASVGVDADGGYAIPDGLDRAIGQVVKDGNPMRGVCNVITVGNEEYRKLYDLGGTASGWVGETDARGATATATFAEIKPFFGEIYANPAATQKILDDAFFDVESWLAQGVGMEFAEEEDDAFLNGTGTNKPKGILQYTLAETADASRTFGQLEKYTTAANNAITADELVNLVYKLKSGYRQNAKFMLPRLTIAVIRKLKGTQNDHYMWSPGLGGEPSSLLGFPLVENEKVPAFAATKPVILFGDFRRAYTIVDVRGIRMLRDPYTNKPYVQFYSTKRVGGMLEDSNALKVLVMKA